jgi:hypothetical protein
MLLIRDAFVPVTRPLPLVGEGEDANGVAFNPIDQLVRKCCQKTAPQCCPNGRPCLRSLRDSDHGCLEGGDEAFSQHRITAQLEHGSGSNFSNCVRYVLNVHLRLPKHGPEFPHHIVM